LTRILVALGMILVVAGTDVLLAAHAATGGRRVALVIGNDDYATLPDLNNAERDARAIATKLEELGFAVRTLTNASERAISRALSRLRGDLGEAEIGLVYFAGHGIHAEGHNYLIPSDARIEDELDLAPEAIRESAVRKALADSGAPVRVVILDACRDNPLPQHSRSLARGLAVEEVEPRGAGGEAVLYAASPGQAAQDGADGEHGMFTAALLRALEEPGLTMHQVFMRTTSLVQRETGGRQVPRMNVSLSSELVLRPAGRRSSPPAPWTSNTSAAALELTFWNDVKDSGSRAMIQEYLRVYPQGTYAELARLKLAALDETKAGSDATETDHSEQVAVGVTFRPGDTFRDCQGCPEMVVVPAGSFRMGSTAAEQAWYVNQGGKEEWAARENPRHQVQIRRSFAVGRYEVTRGQYAEFARATGRSNGDGCYVFSDGKWTKESGRNWRSPTYDQTDNHPVACVSWEDATAYVAWLSRKTEQHYRLLSESEWEYVARAGTTTMRFWGDDKGHTAGCRYANGSDQTRAAQHNLTWNSWNIWMCGDGHVHTAPVGSYAANAFGVHDMLGNVWEWTLDCFHDTYHGAPVDGSAWTT